ncbi:MAG TPA: hypothetical protein VIF83_00855 [Gemmatimonadaceae bacterium]|jgi:hypothetical protein
MKRFAFAMTGAVAAAAFSGCAKPVPVEGSQAPAPTASVSSGAVTRWSGNFVGVTEARSDVRQAQRGNNYGTVTITAADSPRRTRVSLQFSTNSDARFLSWAVLPERCGSSGLAVLPVSSFPELQVGSDGRAQLTAEIPWDLPTSGAYHVNIYKERRSTLDAVVACANLRPS